MVRLSALTTLPLKRFYKYILKRLIGGFLRHDIDLEQLEVQLFKGIVQLKSLELDVTQFDAALLGRGLVMHFASSMLGCVKMDIPWRHLVSDHCKVYISGLHIVVAKGVTGRRSCDNDFFDGAPPAELSYQVGGSESSELEPKSRYSDEGIETLSRLVKRVVSRMEVCLEDASLTALLPPAGGSLCARLSSVVLFSDQNVGPEALLCRTIRVKGISFSILHSNLRLQENRGSGATASTAGAMTETGGEAILASTEASQDGTALAGVLEIQQRKSATIGREDVHVDITFRLPAIRAALWPEAAKELAHCLASLEQAIQCRSRCTAKGLRLESPTTQDASQRSSRIDARPLAQSMVQSLMFESAMPENHDSAKFWQELYGLFEADAQLEDSAGHAGEASFEEQTDEDAQEQEAIKDAIESVPAGSSGPLGVLSGITMQVILSRAVVMLYLPAVRVAGREASSGERISWTAGPRLAEVPLVAGPSLRQRSDQAQLCIQGVELTLTKQLAGVAGKDRRPVFSSCVQRLGLHLHRLSPSQAPLDRPSHLPPEEEEVCPANMFQSIVMASSTGRIVAEPPQIVASEMFRSARSTADRADLPAGGARTPSAPSCRCSTEESLGGLEDSDADSFGESSVHSFEDDTPMALPSQSRGVDLEDLHENLEELFFNRDRPVSEVLLQKLQEASTFAPVAAPSATSGKGRWRRVAPNFLSKQVLEFLSIGHLQGGGSSSSSALPSHGGGDEERTEVSGDDVWPPLPLPGQDHPSWVCFRSLRGVRSDPGKEIWAESWCPDQLPSASAQEDVRDHSSVRIGCQPIQISLCTTSVQMLAVGALAFARQPPLPKHGDDGSVPEELEGIAGRDQQLTSSSEGSEVYRPSVHDASMPLPALVVVSPLVRMVLEFPGQNHAIGDVVLPRLSVPRCISSMASGSSCIYKEFLCFDLESVCLHTVMAKSVEIFSLPAGKPSSVAQYRSALSISCKEGDLKPSSAMPGAGLLDWTKISEASESDQLADEQPGASVSQPSLLEVELSIPGSLQLQADSETLQKLKEEASELANKVAAVAKLALQRQEASQPPQREARTQSPPSLGFTAFVGRISCSLSGVRQAATSAEADLENSRDTDSESDVIQISLEPVRLRLLRGSTETKTSFCALGQDLQIQVLPKDEDDEEGRILIRPWFRPHLHKDSDLGGRQPSVHCSEAASSDFLWEAQDAKSHCLPGVSVFSDAEAGCGCVRLQAVQGAAASVALERLIVLAEQPLIHRVVRWLECFTRGLHASDQQRDEELQGSSDGGMHLQIRTCDCLIDVPSNSYATEWPITGRQSLLVPTPPPSERGVDGDKWRAVLHLSSVAASGWFPLAIAKGVQLEVADANVFLVDHPANLCQLELLSDETCPKRFLTDSGFAHFGELSSAKATWGCQQNELAVDLALGRLSAHLRADTVRCLLCVAAELGDLLPMQAVPAPVALPISVVQTAQAPKAVDTDLGDGAVWHADGTPLVQGEARAFPNERRLADPYQSVTAEMPGDSDQGILQSIDMFAFSPPERAEAPAREDDLVSAGLAAALGQDVAGGIDEMVIPDMEDMPTATSHVPLTELFRASSSCLIDDYIRDQELLQSPRSPVRACPAMDPADDGAVEMELLELPEAEELEELLPSTTTQEKTSHDDHLQEEASGAVAVCLFNPEAFSDGQIQELCSQEWDARAEVEQMFQESKDEEELAPPSPKVKNQEGSTAVCFVDPAGIQIVEDHFVRRSEPDYSQKFDPPAGAIPQTAVVTVRCEEGTLSLYQGTDFEGRLKMRQAERAHLLNERQGKTHVAVQLQGCVVKLMKFDVVSQARALAGRHCSPGRRPTMAPTSLPATDAAFHWRAVVCVRDLAVLDRVHGSVFEHILSYFEDENKRPRPSQADMLYLRVDEMVQLQMSPASAGTSGESAGSGAAAATAQVNAPEYRASVQCLPLRLTVDQDAVDFLAEFAQLCALPTYVEEEGEQDFVTAAGMCLPSEEIPGLGESTVLLHRKEDSCPPAAGAALFFQQVHVGGMLLSVDYRAKRLDVDALRRGDLWELVNLLPLLEGLQVHFRSVTVNGAKGFGEVLNKVVKDWSADLNRTQILRSLTGVTPIRSFANIGGGFADMVLEPLKQYRTGSDAEQVSRTMLRGLISFLRHMTIESIDLTERVFVGAQAALEYANTRLGKDGASERALPRMHAGTIRDQLSREDAAIPDIGGATSSGSGWLPVERGAANFLQPDSAAEGLQEAGENLTRGLRHAGPFLVRPLLEIQRGASREQVLRSVVSGIPMCVLRPALGATAAATTAIRGVRNSVDPSHRREVVRKYKSPG